jgi:hypothetical protein
VEIEKGPKHFAQGTWADFFGWSKKFSTQGPEHCQIDFVKKIAHCFHNKEVFLTIFQHNVREGHLQYLQNLPSDLLGEDDEELDSGIETNHEPS